jgi:MoaA/NifB/PqqE/SkfB family radical SAM enzyme
MEGLFKMLSPKIAFNGVPIFLQYILNSNRIGLATIDTTSKCNLNCKLCYYKRNRRFTDLNISEWQRIWRSMKRKGIRFVAWTGGEPLLRPELIKLGKKYFPYNSIFTNGMHPIPDWQDVVFYVSIDGTEEYYKQIRGENYQLVKNNIKNSPVSVNISMVVNHLNKECLEEFVAEWVMEQKVKMIVFTLYTPPQSEADELALEDSDVVQIIKKLKGINNRYHKVLLTDKFLNSLHPNNRGEVVGDNCVVHNFQCLDSMGRTKTPCCMVGSDCNKCGLYVPYIFHSMFKKLDFKMMNLFFKYCIN